MQKLVRSTRLGTGTRVCNNHVESLVPASSFVTATKGIDVDPCLFTCERDFIRGERDDLAVLFMKLSLAFDELASEKAIYEWQS